MMNPEMMKLAMEQMSKMTPDQMAQMQRQMGNLSPAQMQAYQQQAASMNTDDIQRARAQMNNMSPDQFQQAASQAGSTIAAREKYQLDGAKTLKNAGNQLHSSKQYAAAIEKYTNAKNNLEGQTSEEAREIRKACMLNICSCQLNLQHFDACAKECSEVLASDSNNRKARYRRGQAYHGLRRHADAVSDLTIALELSPDNEKEVVGAKLKEAQQAAHMQATDHSSGKPAQSHAQSDAATSGHQPTAASASSSAPSHTQSQPKASPSDRLAAPAGTIRQQHVVEDGHVSEADSDDVEEIPAAASVQQPAAHRPSPMAVPPGMPPGMDSEQMRNMMQNPGMMRQAAEMMRSMDPAQLQSMARMAGAPAGLQMSPEMLQTASNMMSNMSPEAMQSMMNMAAGSGAAPPGSQPSSGGGPGVAAGPGGAQMNAQMMEEMSKRLSDPATADLLSAFVQSMKAEDLASMLKQSGMDVSTQQAEQYLSMAKKVSPRNMRLLLKASALLMPVATLLKRSRQYTQQHPMVLWAVLFLLIALVCRWLGWL